MRDSQAERHSIPLDPAIIGSQTAHDRLEAPAKSFGSSIKLLKKSFKSSKFENARSLPVLPLCGWCFALKCGVRTNADYCYSGCCLIRSAFGQFHTDS